MARVKIEDLPVERTMSGREMAGVTGGSQQYLGMHFGWGQLGPGQIHPYWYHGLQRYDLRWHIGDHKYRGVALA